jgi:acetylornithine/succinyldiaminopimelate/putrescine aminotransferase
MIPRVAGQDKEETIPSCHRVRGGYYYNMDASAACRRFIADTIDRYPVVWERGAGSRLYDAEGKEYIDFFTGHGVLALGYGHPEQQAAMQAQLARLVHTGNHFHLEVQGRLAAALCGASFADKVFYANSGAESVELAIKLARRCKRRQDRNAPAEVLCMAGSFHGRSYGALSATGQEKYRRDMGPMLPGIGHVPFNDVAALEAAVGPATAAVLLEPVQGDGGVIPATPEFLQAARARCDRYGALLIFDEIQTGLGRCGETFACQGYGVFPDVLLLGKPLGGGLPLSALLTTEPVAAVLGHGDHGSTFGATRSRPRAGWYCWRRSANPVCWKGSARGVRFCGRSWKCSAQPIPGS